MVVLALVDCADDMLGETVELTRSDAGFELEVAISVLDVSFGVKLVMDTNCVMEPDVEISLSVLSTVYCIELVVIADEVRFMLDVILGVKPV